MSNNFLVVGDSISASFYTWIQTFGDTRGYTYNNPPWINAGLSTSPALSGSTLQDYDSTNGIANTLPHFAARCTNYCNSSTVLLIEQGINDLYLMAVAAIPTGSSQARMSDWKAAWTTVNSNLVALGANKPAKVIVLGIPVVHGETLVRSQMASGMGGDWMVMRAIMDRITARACAEYGWTYVTLRGMSRDMLIDTRHPNPAGVAYYASQLLAVA